MKCLQPVGIAYVSQPGELDDVVVKIREILRGNGLARTLSIGELILKRFFDDDEAQWRARRSKKNSSIRQLAARPDCPLGKSALNEAIGVYSTVRRLPFVRTAQHIGASHVAAVLRLELAERREFLQLAEREQWSVRRLRTEVVDRRRQQGERRGRRSLSPLRRVISQLRSSMASVRQSLANVDFEDGLSSEEIGDFQTALSELAQECEELRARVLQAHVLRAPRRLRVTSGIHRAVDRTEARSEERDEAQLSITG